MLLGLVLGVLGLGLSALGMVLAHIREGRWAEERRELLRNLEHLRASALATAGVGYYPAQPQTTKEVFTPWADDYLADDEGLEFVRRPTEEETVSLGG